jgi:hypothetical protein
MTKYCHFLHFIVGIKQRSIVIFTEGSPYILHSHSQVTLTEGEGSIQLPPCSN